MTTLDHAASASSEVPLDPARLLRIGRAIGALYLLGNVLGVASVALMDPLTSTQSLGDAAAASPWAPPAAALSILLMGVTLAFMPVVAYPAIVRVSPVAARSYVLLRGVIELSTYVAAAACLAMVTPLAGASSNAVLTALADHAPVTALIAVGFVGSALVFYSVLWRWRMVPRWITGWGMVATVPYLTGEALVLFGSADASAPLVVGLLGALALQEMALAVWLLWKGLAAPVTPAGSR